ARRDPTHDLWRDFTLDVVPGDLENEQALERLVTGVDAVVHCAGLIKARDRAQFMRTNRDGVRAIAEATRRRSPRARFIAISSLAAREPQLSGYAASKREGEDAASLAYADAPDQLLIIRPPAIYGPWDRETLAIFKAASRPVVPIFGSSRAAIVYVVTAADVIARLATGEGHAGVYALSDDNPAGYSLRELLIEAARALGCQPRFVRVPDAAVLAAGHLSVWWGRLSGGEPIFTPGKAREVLHPDWSIPAEEMLPASVYQENVGIGRGFRETAAWYRAAKWLT
ncbi:MAG: NAD-dependent epimerase/dehydratase family protein, partial [Proteobacteria bacterium]|nr:NAD-dependent epimerase/dehydratase family protein [Pseudomonadota bacterium]